MVDMFNAFSSELMVFVTVVDYTAIACNNDSISKEIKLLTRNHNAYSEENAIEYDSDEYWLMLEDITNAFLGIYKDKKIVNEEFWKDRSDLSHPYWKMRIGFINNIYQK